jgi:hypothetical protein
VTDKGGGFAVPDAFVEAMYQQAKRSSAFVGAERRR